MRAAASRTAPGLNGMPRAYRGHQPDAFVQRRQRNVHGQIHAAGPLGEGPLEHVHPVGGEDERDVGVMVQAVHGVEHLEQQRLRPVPEASVLGNQVAVLKHNDRRLQCPGHGGSLGDPGQ